MAFLVGCRVAVGVKKGWNSPLLPCLCPRLPGSPGRSFRERCVAANASKVRCAAAPAAAGVPPERFRHWRQAWSRARGWLGTPTTRRALLVDDRSGQQPPLLPVCRRCLPACLHGCCAAAGSVSPAGPLGLPGVARSSGHREQIEPQPLKMWPKLRRARGSPTGLPELSRWGASAPASPAAHQPSPCRNAVGTSCAILHAKQQHF